MNKAYCQTCNAPKTDGVAILMRWTDGVAILTRCGLCVVQQGKPPTKYVPKENSNDRSH